MGSETFIVSGLPHVSATASRRWRASSTCGPLTPRVSASSRILSARGSSGRCTGCPNPGTLPPQPWIARATSRATAAGSAPAATSCLRVLEQPRALLRRAEDDGAAAEDPRRDGSLQRAGVGGERHPCGDVGGHHPVLGDRDEQHVEEVALVVGRLLPREQQVEVLGEARGGPSGRRRDRAPAPRPGREMPARCG